MFTSVNTHWRLLAFFGLLVLLSVETNAQQEWAYHHGPHADHTHILTAPSLNGDRIIASTEYSNLGSSLTIDYPIGNAMMMRQKSDGTVEWSKQYFSGYLFRPSAMKLVPGTSGSVIAVVGHIRLSDTGDLNDRSVVFFINSSDGSIYGTPSIINVNPNGDLESRLLDFDFYTEVLEQNTPESLMMACVGWIGDVTSTGADHSGLLVLINATNVADGTGGPQIHASYTVDSPVGQSPFDWDLLGEVNANDGSLLLMGSTNQDATTGDIDQASLAMRVNLDGSTIWSRGYADDQSASTTDHSVAVSAGMIGANMVLLTNHFHKDRFAIHAVNPSNGGVLQSQFVDITTAVSTTGNAHVFDMLESGDNEIIMGGYIRDYNWVDAFGNTHLGNVPFHMEFSFSAAAGLSVGDYVVHRIDAEDAGETVNNWAYSPYPDDRWMPYVYHPDMLAFEPTTSNTDVVMTGYRSRWAPFFYDLDIVPSSLDGVNGPCEAVTITPDLPVSNMIEFAGPNLVSLDLVLIESMFDDGDITLQKLDCGAISTPPCNLPTSFTTTIDCFDLDVTATGGGTPATDVHYIWDFGDGSPTVSGDGLFQPPTHTYAANGTYTVTSSVTV